MSARGDRHDIEDRADCERLVRAFYGRTLDDPLIGWIFVDVAKLDLERHVPVVASFWETILLGAQSYGGGMFRPHALLHAKVGLRAAHFERWLVLWHTTVDELFAGERAELAKSHATRVGRSFHSRLQPPATGPDGARLRPPATGPDGVPAVNAAPPVPGGLLVTKHGPGR